MYKVLGMEFQTLKQVQNYYIDVAKQFNQNIIDLGDDIALSHYYAQHMADNLSKAEWTKTWKNMPYRDKTYEAADKIFLAKVSTRDMSFETMEQGIKQMRLYMPMFQENGIMNIDRINAKAKAHMDAIGVYDKKTYVNVSRIMRHTDFAAYIVYEVDPTRYQTTVSNLGELHQMGFKSEDIENMVNKMFSTKIDDKPATIGQVEKMLNDTVLLSKKEVEEKWLM